MVTVEHVESRADLAECMTHLCEAAKRESRRGRVGTSSARYAELHEDLDLLLEFWQIAPT